MDLSWWILTKKLHRGDADKNGFRPSITVSTIGIAIGIAIMVITLCVVIGFKNEITNKVAGFGSHIQVINFEHNNTFELKPIFVTDSLLSALSQTPHVTFAAPFVTKPGIIKTDSLIQTMVVKGMKSDIENSNWQFLRSYLITGSLPSHPDDILISQTISRKIGKTTGDFLIAYFIDDNIRVRKYTVVGIYESGLTDFDKLITFTLMESLQELNKWETDLVSGIEIKVDNMDNINEVDDAIYGIVANKNDKNGNMYFVQNLKRQNPQIFSWLALLNMNIAIILILMGAVALFSIVTGIVIILIEHIRMIGILKVLGATNGFIRRLFFILGMRMVGRGLIIGNLIGLGLCVIQYFTHFFPLNPNVYYVHYVPISFPWMLIVIVNLAMALLSFGGLIFPTHIVSKVNPASVVKFE